LGPLAGLCPACPGGSCGTGGWPNVRLTERSTITMNIKSIEELKKLEEYIELLSTEEIQAPCGEKIKTKRNFHGDEIRTRTTKLTGHHILIEIVEQNEKKISTMPYRTSIFAKKY